MSSGIYGTSENLGFWLTPIVSGFLAEKFGYHFTCDFMATLSLLFALLYYVVIVRSKKKEKVYSKIETKFKKTDMMSTEISYEDI